jgi:hypothetical protein
MARLSTSLTDHFDLFGRKQAWARAPAARLPTAVPVPVQPPSDHGRFRDRVLGRAPGMTVGRLLFAGGATAASSSRSDSRSTTSSPIFGEAYGRCMQAVPRFIPAFGRRARVTVEARTTSSAEPPRLAR